MITSGDVAELFQAQNQSFMARNQFATQLGVTAPGGFPGQGFGVQYNQGNLSPGFGAGNRVAGSAFSAMSGAAAFGSTAIGAIGLGGALGMFGKIGTVASVADPFGAAAAGFRAFGGGGMGIAAGGLMGAGVFGAGYLASRGLGSFIQGGLNQQQIGNSLAQNFQFNNPAARGGQGFTRDDARSIGDSIRSLAHIPEMMTSVEELTKLLPKMKSMGVMQGVKDAGEFATRFKESVKTIRDISKIMGTSMEEATKFFELSRSMGMLGRKDQLQNMVNAQFTAGLTGMSLGQVGAMQLGGANYARQIGARGRLGVSAVTNIAQSLGAAQQEGRIGQGALEDITGLQGEEAVGAAAQRFTQVMSDIGLSSSAGRFAIAGAMKLDKDGRATIDQDVIRRFRSGELTMDDLRKRGMSLSDKEKISFMTRQKDLSMEFAGAMGPGGFAGMMEQLVGGKGREAVNLMLQRHGGVSAGEADVMMDLSGQVNAGEMEKAQFMKLRAVEADIADRTDPSKIMARLKTKAHAKIFGGLEKMGAEAQVAIGKAVDSAIDDLVGRHVATMSEQGMRAVAKAFSSGTGRQEFTKMVEQASGLKSDGRGGGGIMSSIRESDLAASLMAREGETGRTATAELRATLRNFGIQAGNMTVAEQGKALQDRSAAMLKVTDTKDLGLGAGRQAVREMIKEMGADFLNADDAEKVEMLKKKIEETNVFSMYTTGDETRDAHREALRKAVKSAEAMGFKIEAGQEGMLGMMLATGAEGEERMSKISRGYIKRLVSGASRDDNIKSIKTRIDRAMESLSSSLGPSKAAFIKKAGMQDALGKAGSGSNKAKVKDILDSRASDDAKADALKALGINVSATDIDMFRETLETLSTGQGRSLLDDFSKATAASDLQLFQSAAADAAVGISGGESSIDALKKSLEALSSPESSHAEILKARDDIQSNVEAIASKAQGLKGSERTEFLKKAGRFGSVVEGAISVGANLRNRTMSAKDIAKELRVEEGDLGDLLKDYERGGSIKVTDDVLKQIRTKMAGLKTGLGLSKDSQSQTAGETTSDKLINTLTSIDKTLSQSNTIMSALGAKLGVDTTVMLGPVSDRAEKR